MTEEIIKEEFDKAFKKNFPEAVIIDGVDVAGCVNLNSLICNCGVICKGRDCYYKQLKRLEQENDALKSQLDFEVQSKEVIDELEQENKELKEKIKKYSAINEQDTKDYAILRNALEEIREFAKQQADVYNSYEIDSTPAYEWEDVVNKINEVLND